MAILKVDFKAGGTSIKQTYTGAYIRVVTTSGSTTTVTKYPIYNVSGSVVYAVLTNDANATDFEILNSVLLPVLGERYTDQKGNVYNGVFYQDNSARYIAPLGSGFLWEVTYNVSGQFTTTTPPADSETILTFSASIELQDEARPIDLDGVYNVNSLGLFFDDPLLVKTGVLNLNYQRREYENPLQTIIDYTNTINNAALWGFPVATLRVASISANITMTENDTAYDVSYQIQYNPRTWHTQKANSSFYTYNGSTYSRALNADGSPTENPVFINAAGVQLPAGTAPLWRAFRVYPLADLADLGLPDPFLM